MNRASLLILTTHVSSLCKGETVKNIIRNVKNCVVSTVYVHIHNTHPLAKQFVDEARPKLNKNETITRILNIPTQLNRQNADLQSCHFSSDVLSFVKKFYSEASLHCSDIDINILLHNVGQNSGEIVHSDYEHTLKKPIMCVFVDLPHMDDEGRRDIVRDFVTSKYSYTLADNPHEKKVPIQLLESVKTSTVASAIGDDGNDSIQNYIEKRESVVLGGTFDRLHVGHKVLLSESILLAKRKIVIGMSNGPLLKNKVLRELMEPFQLRRASVENFISSVAHVRDPSSSKGLELIIASIEDPYGPSITDRDLEVIVVSQETHRGGHMVNEKRLERGLSQLEVHVISEGELVKEEASKDLTIPFTESKVSSSVKRFHLLGKLLNPISEPSDPLQSLPESKVQPYVIGLTGGIASGKSSVARKLEKVGARILDCDAIGHQAYSPGTETFKKIVSHFGNDVVDPTKGTIDRRILGSKVFADKTQLESLNSIVWPEIERLCRSEIENWCKTTQDELTASHNYVVFVLDAAVLLEAGWDKFSHEIWVISVPLKEAVQRLMDRNGLTEEQAKLRINSQLANDDRIQQANVVLSTLWEPSVTLRQVESAWKLLQDRLEKRCKAKCQATISCNDNAKL